MLDRLFRRRHTPQLPTSSAELAEALRTAAQFADSDSAKLEYTTAADALDRAVAHTRAHGDAPTRDALAYALGRAELNLKEQLSELIEVSKETHLIVQDVQAAQQTAHPQIGEALAGIAILKKEWSDWEAWRGRVEATIGGFMESRDLSLADRAELKQVVAEIDKRLIVVEEILDLIPRPKTDS